MIYAALFCLEYSRKPSDIEMELRIYQDNNVVVCVPEPEVIMDIIQKIISFDKIINKMRKEED